jgi:ArsR family transcriptional regulator, arsenate/arsenite/antimonite-responsive transcriptional repressor / arsenate reductase (thioredoxin)
VKGPDEPNLGSDGLALRAAVYAALGEPARLAIVEDLAVSDWSPKELGNRLGLPSNVVAHHLDVLEDVGLVVRFGSAGDKRRKYVRLVREPLSRLSVLHVRPPVGPMLFVCSQNSARSQLASALWSARTGLESKSAGTRPAHCVDRGAIAAARRAGLSLDGASPQALGAVPDGTQVVTVCDQAHEQLAPEDDWWHWSIPDPVAVGTASAFDEVVSDLSARISTILDSDLRTEQATQ